jgi:outer membrane protein W
MKKLLLLFIGSVFVLTTQAQDLFVGAKGSYVLSSMTGLETNYLKSTNEGGNSGIGGGLFLNYQINDNLSFSLDFTNNVRGAKYQRIDSLGGGATQTYNFYQKFKAFDFPLTLNYHFLKFNNKIDPYVSLGLAGAAFHYTNLETEITTNFKVGERDSSIVSTIKTDNTTTYNKIDYNAVGGIGCNYHINSKIRAGIEVRYFYGLLDIRENKVVFKDEALEVPKSIKNNALNVSLGIAYNIASSGPEASPAEKAEKAKAETEEKMKKDEIKARKKAEQDEKDKIKTEAKAKKKAEEKN